MSATQGLPANVDAERFVLGAVLLDDVVFPTVAAAVSQEEFALEKHRRIFRRMGELHARGERIDRMTVYEELNKHGEVQSCDGLAYLVSLDDGLPQAPNVDSYLRILKEKAGRRRVIFACQHLQNRAMLADESLHDIAREAQELFLDVAVGRDGPAVADLPALRDCGSSEIAYLRNPELPRGAVVALTGDSGSGKSTLACAWARDAARTGTRSLLLDRENPLPAVVERFDRIHAADQEHIKIWGGWLPQEAPMPDSPAVLEWVRSCDPRPLVILDSFSAFHREDQNDAGLMRAFMHRCRRLADLGATVIVIHHDGKAESAKDYRGSSDFKAAIDIGFHVSNFGDGGRLGKLTLRPFKSRFGFNGSRVYSYADGHFQVSEVAEVQRAVSDQLTSLLRLNPGIGVKQFEDLATKTRNISRAQAREFLDGAVLSGVVRCEKGQNNARRHYLVEQGPENEF